MDKKALLAIVLSFGIWMGWQKFYLEPYQKQATALQQQQEAERKASLRQQNKEEIDAIGITPKPFIDAKKAQASRALSLTNLETNSYQIQLTNGPSLINSWKLKSYYNTLENKNDTVNLKLITGFQQQLRLRIPEDSFKEFNDTNWNEVKNGTSFVSNVQAPGITAERKLDIKENAYFADVNYRLVFSAAPPRFVFVDVLGSPKRENDTEGSVFGEAPDKVHFTFRDANSRTSVMGNSLKETKESFAGIKWLGVDTRYFVMALVPDRQLRQSSGVQIKSEFVEGAPAVRGSLVVPTNGAKEITIPLRVYFGPKHLESLEAADPILSDAIDFGWTSAIAIPLLKGLKWLYSFLGNYGLAIMVLTFLIKVLLYPLMYKSMKATAKMSKLQPQLNALREKYKDDKEKLNTEMMNFMKTNGYNPVGGCLPMLLQMPIFFALYRVFFNSIELYQAPFFLWIHDLSKPDPFFITPVLLAGLMYLQQKMSPVTVADPAQQKMMQLMPVMFGVFMLLLPSGLNIYMLVNSAVTIVQQQFLNKKFGIGKYASPAPAKGNA